MTLIHATTQTTTCSPFARAMARKIHGRAANDNDYGDYNDNDTNVKTDRDMLNSALRYFAQHGLGAAHEARKNAEAAFFDGDRKGYDWWLGICRKLDRSLAMQADKIALK